jgi:hypothetical protein
MYPSFFFVYATLFGYLKSISLIQTLFLPRISLLEEF